MFLSGIKNEQCKKKKEPGRMLNSVLGHMLLRPIKGFTWSQSTFRPPYFRYLAPMQCLWQKQLTSEHHLVRLCFISIPAQSFMQNYQHARGDNQERNRLVPSLYDFFIPVFLSISIFFFIKLF